MNSGVSSAAMPLKFANSLNAPFHRALGRRAVVSDDVVDDRVVENPQVIDHINQPTNVMIGVLEEPGVHLHLPGQHRLQLVRHVIPSRDLGMPGGQLGFRRDDSQLLLTGECTLPLHVPAVIEGTFVTVGPLLGDVVRGVRRARREIHKERLLRHQRLLLTHPRDGPIGQILGQVIALLWRRRRLDRRRTVIERRIPLVVLATDEPVERLETAASRRPRVEGAHR
jgi:hypothetical protein